MKRVKLLSESEMSLLEHAQAVQARAGGRGDGGDVVAAALAHHLGGHGGVFADGDLHVLEGLEERGALADGLLMADDLADGGEGRAGPGDEPRWSILRRTLRTMEKR